MIPDPETLQKRGVQFLATGNHYSYAAVNLATGLDKLGIPVKGTMDYKTPVHSEFVFRKCPPDSEVALRVIDVVDGGFDYKRPFEAPYPKENTAILNMTGDADAFLYYGDLKVFRAHASLDQIYPYHYEPIGRASQNSSVNSPRFPSASPTASPPSSASSKMARTRASAKPSTLPSSPSSMFSTTSNKPVTSGTPTPPFTLTNCPTA
jgi:hypothetical protein